MRLLIERVKEARCVIDEKEYSKINQGYLVYVAFCENDNSDTINKAVSKIMKLRIFEDDNHKINLDITKVNGEILCISSFSLYGDIKESNRPSFVKSLSYDLAKPLYLEFCEKLKEVNTTYTGVFGADMKIYAINDGPLSIIYDL